MNQYPSQQPSQSPDPMQPPQYPYPMQQPPQYQQQAYPFTPMQQQQPKPRRRGCLISAIVAVVVVVAVIAIAAAASGKTNNTGTLSSGSSNNTGGATTSNQTFKVGDVVTVGNNWQVTVNGVKTDTGNSFDQPKAGNTFLEVSVTMKNISSQEQDASSLISWSLKDNTGQKYDETIVSNAPSSPDGKVAAGDKLTGTVAYEVPQTQKHFELSFVPDLTSSGQTIWNLQL